MSKQRKHRVIRTAVLTVMIAISLVSTYFSSFVGVHWLLGRGMIRGNAYGLMTETLFAPAAWYTQSELPGARTANAVTAWCFLQGRGTPVPWSMLAPP